MAVVEGVPEACAKGCCADTLCQMCGLFFELEDTRPVTLREHDEVWCIGCYSKVWAMARGVGDHLEELDGDLDRMPIFELFEFYVGLEGWLQGGAGIAPG